jgi:hypothetical protein
MSIPVLIWRVYLAVAGLVATAALVLAAYAFYDAQQDAEELRQAAVNSCHTVGDPLVDAVVHLARADNRATREDVRQDKLLPPSFFPNIPPRDFKNLMAQNERIAANEIEANDQIIHRLLSVPTCEQRYPDS